MPAMGGGKIATRLLLKVGKKSRHYEVLPGREGRLSRKLGIERVHYINYLITSKRLTHLASESKLLSFYKLTHPISILFYKDNEKIKAKENTERGWLRTTPFNHKARVYRKCFQY